MRNLSDKEKQLVKRFVDLKSEGDLKHLQVAYQLRSNLEFLALKWETLPSPKVCIYVPKKDNVDKSKVCQEYLKIADFIYFIEELCNNGFLQIQHLPSSEEKTSCTLYDRDKFEFNEELDQFIQKNINPGDSMILELFGDAKYSIIEKKGGVEGISGLSKSILPNSFANTLQRIALGLIYPLPIAEDYVKNNFKTLEQRQFDNQIQKAQNSLYWSIAAFVVALLTLMATLYVGWKQLNSSQRLDEIQFKEITDDIKECNHFTIISIPCKDTVRLNNIDSIATKPITKEKK
jgi:hypothetical protein